MHILFFTKFASTLVKPQYESLLFIKYSAIVNICKQSLTQICSLVSFPIKTCIIAYILLAVFRDGHLLSVMRERIVAQRTFYSYLENNYCVFHSSVSHILSVSLCMLLFSYVYIKFHCHVLHFPYDKRSLFISTVRCDSSLASFAIIMLFFINSSHTIALFPSP